MPNSNPYSPPLAVVADQPISPSWLPVKIISGLSVIHLVLTYHYSTAYWELVRTGASHPLALLFGVVGAFSLYVAALLSAFERRGSRKLFATASICLSVSYYFWGWQYAWALAVAFGAILAGLGWWFVRKTVPKPLQPLAANG